ncbi:unnamed protein product [Rotaria sp. Silwood1]|nr:unnamed protein product [Rotaria sp. Silwood1]
MECPSLPVTSFERHFLNMTKIFCTIIFTIEMMIYVIAHEFIFGSDTYIHNRWNIRNGFVVIISIVDLTTMYCSTVIPLNTESEEATFISRASGLELVLQALISSFRPIDHIIVDLTTMYWSTVIPLNTESEEATCIFVMLRVINRASGLKLVLQALMSSLRPIDHIYERQEKTTYLTKCTLELERRRCRKHELSYYVPWRRR